MQDQHTSTSPLAGMSQGKTFVLGIVAGFLVLCTVGFFVLLSMQLGGGQSSGGRVVAPSGGQVAPPAGGGTAPTSIVLAPVQDDEHIRGNKNAKITLVEYSDFECPFCSRFLPSVEQALAKYPNDLRVVYRHFPLRSIHPEAANAANASECAAEQGKFWEYHDELFARQATLGTATYSQIATELGLKMAQFDECVSSQKYASVVQADEASSQQAGAQGTPYSILVGPDGQQSVVNGAQPFEVIDAAIQQML